MNFFASLAISGMMNLLFYIKEKGQFKYGDFVAYFVAIGTIVFFFVYSAYQGVPSSSIVRHFFIIHRLVVSYMDLVNISVLQ